MKQPILSRFWLVQSLVLMRILGTFGQTVFLTLGGLVKLKFDLKKKDGTARRGQLTFERGSVQTPAFMPVGTYGTVKGMTPEEVKGTGAEILLGNTFHLWLRPDKKS